MTGSLLITRVLLCAAAFELLAPPAVNAYDPNMPVAVVRSAKSPIQITRCKIQGYVSGSQSSVFINLVNHSKHRLLKFTIDLKFYDADQMLIGRGDKEFIMREPLASGESTIAENSSMVEGIARLSEPETAIARSSCGLKSASFTGGTQWKSG